MERITNLSDIKGKESPLLKEAYQPYLDRQQTIPLTFIHDDLLPINVLSENGEITIIDWGYGRLGSYAVDITRFYGFYSADKNSYEKGFSFLDLVDSKAVFFESLLSKPNR
ncbi:phosphotransferase family protein [Amphibacillus sp. Q70]|uniref:phosphotransferase family protein n=1 Tax=Amphibacillus sp. Q70 TaxID=3453416 RepID=UPI003F83C027